MTGTQHNVSMWIDTSFCGLLSQWASTTEIQLSVLILCNTRHYILLNKSFGATQELIHNSLFWLNLNSTELIFWNDAIRYVQRMMCIVINWNTKNNNLEERGKIDTTNTQIRAWLATGTSIKSAGVKLGLWTQNSFLSEIMYV